MKKTSNKILSALIAASMILGMVTTATAAAEPDTGSTDATVQETTVEAPAGNRNFEVPYFDREKGLYLEVHSSLFEPESELFSSWNIFFSDCYAQPRKLMIYGTEICTLSDTDNFFI